jgi:hypothetical protein
MAQFLSLQSVLSEKLNSQKVIQDNNISFRAPISDQLQMPRIVENFNIQESDVLRWGYSNWGIERVTSQYKPREVK